MRVLFCHCNVVCYMNLYENLKADSEKLTQA